MDPVSPPPPPKRRLSAPLVILLALVGAGLLVYGWWSFIYWPTTPQYALDRFFEAANAHDFDKVYDMVEVKGPLKGFVGSGAALRTMAERFPGLLPQVESHSYGDTQISGDHAKVHTTITMRRQGIANSNTMDVELSRTNGIWRIDGDWIFREIVRQRAGGLLLNGQ